MHRGVIAYVEGGYRKYKVWSEIFRVVIANVQAGYRKCTG